MRARRLALLTLGLAPLACAHPAPAPFPRPFHVIAHRGASAYAPENTLPAFEKALALGAFEVELDVQLSEDQRVVLFHDRFLDRKTSLAGRVRDHTSPVLTETDIGSWFDAAHPDAPERFQGTPLTTLPRLFKTFGRSLYYHVEIKSDESWLVRQILLFVRLHGLADRVTVTSFQLPQLRRVRELNPDIPIHLLLKRPVPKEIDQAAELGFDGVGLPASEITRELVAHAHRWGLEARAFGVKSDADMDRAIAAGANGMTTNWPDRLIRRLVEHMGTGTGTGTGTRKEPGTGAGSGGG